MTETENEKDDDLDAELDRLLNDDDAPTPASRPQKQGNDSNRTWLDGYQRRFREKGSNQKRPNVARDRNDEWSDEDDETPEPTRQHPSPSKGQSSQSKQQKELLQRLRRNFPPSGDMNVFVSCHPGLEPILSQELTALGLAHDSVAGGANLLEPATVQDILSCHLHLGTASHVLLRCGEPFTARGLGELKRKVLQLPWKDLLQEDVQLKLTRVSSTKSKLQHSTAIRDRILQAIYAVLGREWSPSNEKEDVKQREDRPVIPLVVRIVRDRVQISLDTSLTPLHQRGYRLETGKAPLREDLAYAMLYSAGWRPPSVDAPPMYKALLDPFCGSGTIAIEAAAVVAGIPPGRLRPAPLQGTRLFDSAQWSNLTSTALKNADGMESGIQIAASDRDKGSVASTLANAERAGVANLITALDCSFSDQPWLSPSDTVISPKQMLIATNPPWGRRVPISCNKKGQSKKFLPLYQRLSDRFDRLSDEGDVALAILSNDPILVRKGGFKTKLNVKFSTKHGGISCCSMFTSSALRMIEDKSTATSEVNEEEDLVAHSS